MTTPTQNPVFELNGKSSLLNFGIGVAGLVFGCIAFVQSNDNQTEIASLKPVVQAIKNVDGDTAELKTKVSTLLEKGTLTKDDIEAFIMDNPEVMIKSLTKFRMEQEAKQGAAQPATAPTGDDSGAAYADQLLNDKIDPIMGNPNGKHVITVFSDYNCGHCKRLELVLEDWLAVDPEAKLILKEFPIFQNIPTSMGAAVVGLSIYNYAPAKYAEFHERMMKKTPQVQQADIESALADLGLSMDELKSSGALDVAQRQIEKTRTLATKLQVGGTPTMFMNGSTRTGGSNHTVESLMSFF